MIRNIILLFTILGMPYANVLAQQKGIFRNSASNNLKIGVAPSLIAVKDEILSSMIFRGPALSIHGGWENSKENRTQGLTISYSIGSLKASNSADKWHINNLDVNYKYFFSIVLPKSELWKLDIGAQIAFQYNQRKYTLINSSRSFEKTISMAPLIGLTYFFNESHQYSISNHLILPVFSLLQQPVFGDDNTLATYESASSRNILKNWESAVLRTYSSISNKSAIHKNLENGNQLTLEYDWNYYAIKTNRPVKQSVNQIVVQYSFKL